VPFFIFITCNCVDMLQGVLNLIASCIREVIQLYGGSEDCKFTLLMEWLSEICDDMAFFD